MRRIGVFFFYKQIFTFLFRAPLNGQWVGSLANIGLCGGEGYWFKTSLSQNETMLFIYEDLTDQAPRATKKSIKKNKNRFTK